MSFQYKTLSAMKERGMFQHFFMDILGIQEFTSQQSNRIITDLVRKIEQYEKRRGIETSYERDMTSKGERIVKAEMKSRDNIIQGKITYEPPWEGLTAKVSAIFDFKTNDEAFKNEYLGLSKILQETLP